MEIGLQLLIIGKFDFSEKCYIYYWQN